MQLLCQLCINGCCVEFGQGVTRSHNIAQIDLHLRNLATTLESQFRCFEWPLSACGGGGGGGRLLGDNIKNTKH